MSIALITGKVIYTNQGFGLPYSYPLASGDTVNYAMSEYNLKPSLEEINDYDDKTSVTVNIAFSIPTSELASSQYQKTISIFENARKNAINEWFQKVDPDTYNSSVTSLNITNQKNGYTIKNTPTYYSSKFLTLEELKELDTYSTVTINVYNYDKGIDQDYSLTDYLKEVQNNDFE